MFAPSRLPTSGSAELTLPRSPSSVLMALVSASLAWGLAGVLVAVVEVSREPGAALPAWVSIVMVVVAIALVVGGARPVQGAWRERGRVLLDVDRLLVEQGDVFEEPLVVPRRLVRAVSTDRDDLNPRPKPITAFDAAVVGVLVGPAPERATAVPLG